MGVEKATQYMVFCDDCGDLAQTIIGEDGTIDKSTAIKEFRLRGWRIGRDSCSCPKCFPNLKSRSGCKKELNIPGDENNIKCGEGILCSDCSPNLKESSK